MLLKGEKTKRAAIRIAVRFAVKRLKRCAYFFLWYAASARAIAPRTAAAVAGSGTVKVTDSEVSPNTASHWIPLVFPSNTVSAMVLPVS